ncbi:LysR family transcriptional regulator [Terasakiella pusilla]|uniref:LysR family transcriptional regulator n=1 Tax=Terasakiella pusilla TaxID=64973 RepID=UPI00048EB189|nr:LysR family transcriptional regulator [Terasakiella pusilla]
MNRAVPNLRHLRAFSSVAEFKSISKASKEIYLSQPAITQAIAKLEKQLDVQLFDRQTDGMYLTEAGSLFVDRVNRMLRYFKTGADEAAAQGGKRKTKGFQNLEHLITGVQVRALIALSEAGNFSLAARMVGISQPSLHRAARDLEHMAGVPLFEKSRRGVELSKAAECLAFHSRLAAAELEQGYDELEEWKGQDSGAIVVGTMPLARTFMLPTAINALTRDKPEIKMNVVDGPYDDLLNGLRHGSIDLLIGALRDPIPVDDIVQEAVFDDPLAIVGRNGHPLSLTINASVEELAQFAWVVPRQGTPTRRFFEKMFEGSGCYPKSVIESSSLILIRSLLSASDRLTIISLHQIRHEKQMGVLAPLPLEMSQTKRSIGLTMRKDWRPTATQARFIQLLRDAGRVIHSS